MIWSVEWDGPFVVGGDGNRRLSPNFRLREFQDSTGKVRVHRELVSALQILRDRLAKPMSLDGVDADGLGATVQCAAEPDGLRDAARRVAKQGVLDTVEESGRGLHVRIHDPARLPEIELEQALETAFSVTSGFETSGDRFQQVTGNFDGAGISFGPAQWNFKTGTLVPLFRRFQAADESALRACFTDASDYEEWLAVLDRPPAGQIAWATSVSAGSRGQDVMEPWKGYLRAVGRVQRFRALMVETALREYGTKLMRAVDHLRRLCPDIVIDHLRCACSLYDLVIQQGSLDRAEAEIEARVRAERPKDQFELVRIAVEERGKKADAQWQADCISRRLGVLNGVPTPVDGRQRANISFYMLRDVRIRDARDVATLDIDERLARVGRAVASGDSLLA